MTYDQWKTTDPRESEPWEQWTQEELDNADERETVMAQSIEFQQREETADLRERNAQLETTVRQAVANNDALHERNAKLVAVLEWLDREGGLGLEVHKRIRDALAS